MTVKFNQMLIQAYNMREESEERTKLIQAICEKNVKICKEKFGEKSIFQIRPLYT